MTVRPQRRVLQRPTMCVALVTGRACPLCRVRRPAPLLRNSDGGLTIGARLNGMLHSVKRKSVTNGSLWTRLGAVGSGVKAQGFVRIRSMKDNDLMRDAAVNRLEYWEATRASAAEHGDTVRMLDAQRFIDEYRVLILEMDRRAALKR
jgi:hypothetical protein